MPACSTWENWVGGAHIVVVVCAGSSTQDLIVPLQEGMKAALKSLEFLEHLDVLHRGRMAEGIPRDSEPRLSSMPPSQLTGTTCADSPGLPASWANPSLA